MHKHVKKYTCSQGKGLVEFSTKSNPKWALHSGRRMAPLLLRSSTSLLVPGHVGLRQHSSTVGALPLLCSVHSWCKGVGALRCILSSSCFPGLLSSPCNACTGFACSSMPCYVVFGDIFATCSAPCSAAWDLPLSLPCTSFYGSSSYSPRQKWRCTCCM